MPEYNSICKIPHIELNKGVYVMRSKEFQLLNNAPTKSQIPMV